MPLKPSNTPDLLGHYEILLDLRQEILTGHMDQVRDRLASLLPSEFEPVSPDLVKTVQVPRSPSFVEDELPTRVLIAPTHPQDAIDTVVHSDEGTILEALSPEDVTRLQGAGSEALPGEQLDETWFRGQIRELLLELGIINDDASALAAFEKSVLHPFEIRYPQLLVSKLASVLERQLSARSVVRLAEGAMGWVFLATLSDGSQRVVKVPKPHISEHSEGLYEREILFYESYYRDLHTPGQESWFPHYDGDGTMNVQGRQFQYGIFEYCRGPLRQVNDRETQSALTLRELMPMFPQLHPAVSLLLVEHMLLALEELQTLMVGIIHRDLKPENYFLSPEMGALLWRIRGYSTSDLSASKLLLLLQESKQLSRRLITNDFGLVLEMKPNLLSDPIKDGEGEVLVGGTPRYTNAFAVNRHGAYAHSDRFSIACILYEMICGFPAQSEQGKNSDGYVFPKGLSPDQRQVLELAIGILNDPREHRPHTNNDEESLLTVHFLQGVRSLLRDFERSLNPSFRGKLRRAATRIFENLMGD